MYYADEQAKSKSLLDQAREALADEPGSAGYVRITVEVRDALVELADAALSAEPHTRQPIDLNFIAIPKDAWEDMLAALERLRR